MMKRAAPAVNWSHIQTIRMVINVEQVFIIILVFSSTAINHRHPTTIFTANFEFAEEN